MGLANGNYFLNTSVAGITSNGIELDGAHNGVGGSATNNSGQEVDEFWRLFGDVNGDRTVNAQDSKVFASAYGSNNSESNYVWYLDVDMDGNINTTDYNAFKADFGVTLKAVISMVNAGARHVPGSGLPNKFGPSGRVAEVISDDGGFPGFRGQYATRIRI